MSETLSPRVQEILEAGRKAYLANAEAARLGLTGLCSGGLALEAARARLTETGVDPDTCDADQLAAALEAVGEIPDDVTIVPPDAPPEPELVVDSDLDRAARRHLVARGLEMNERNYVEALHVVGAQR